VWQLLTREELVQLPWLESRLAWKSARDIAGRSSIHVNRKKNTCVTNMKTIK